MDKIYVPEKYEDAILEHPHTVVKTESVYTCMMSLMKPQSMVGKIVSCEKCGMYFEVVKGERPE